MTGALPRVIMDATEAPLQGVLARIHAACEAAGRQASQVHLLAVSKTMPADRIRALAAQGHRAFGENYVQELSEKSQSLADLALEWHFIGPLQSNKTRVVAACAAWVHSIDRLSIAHRLSAQRPAHLSPLNLCLQVNVSGEATKSGVAPADVLALAQAVAQLPNVRLRGLMCIPEPSQNMQMARIPFAQLRQIKDDLVNAGLQIDTLSMGMSADLEAAIFEGATWIRVGTALFGARHLPLKDRS